MVRSRRSISKEDASSVLADSGISLSSPTSATVLLLEQEVGDEEEEEEMMISQIISDEEDALATATVAAAATPSEASIKAKDENEQKHEQTTIVAELSSSSSSSSASSLSPPTVSSVAKRKAKANKRRRSTKLAAAKTRKSYECHVCHKQFGGNTDLRRHLLIHTDERPFKCEQCGKTYRQLVNLKNHLLSVHDRERQFGCKFCPKAFALKDRLRLHMRVHSGEKPYECTQCGKKFARGGQLQQHLVTHDGGAGVKTMSCDKCSAAFSSAANLRLHLKCHEDGPNHKCQICNELFLSDLLLRAHVNTQHFKLKQFECDVCRQTIEDDDLATHMKTHGNTKTHVCEVCNSLFTQKSQYNVHMRMHTGERPYQCRICWQSFAHSSVLKLHIRKHTGEKPFKCVLCKKDVVAFSQLAHLKTHMKKIHKQANPYMCEGCQQFFKMKIELQSHAEKCEHSTAARDGDGAQNKSNSNGSNNADSSSDCVDVAAQLSQLRFMVALLLKKISSQQKLLQLGYEKRLIDNVIIASLKLANRKTCDDTKLSEIDRMRLNVQEFLDWIVPTQVMDVFKREQLSVEKILDKIVTLYMKQN